MDRGKIMDLGTVDDLIARHGGPSVVEVEGLDRAFAVEPRAGSGTAACAASRPQSDDAVGRPWPTGRRPTRA